MRAAPRIFFSLSGLLVQKLSDRAAATAKIAVQIQAVLNPNTRNPPPGA